MRFLQNHPRFLEVAYAAVVRLLPLGRRWLKPGGLVERLVIPLEHLSKGAVFNCQMCGQCVLHSTGMTCPMNCPKNLRNGPCGGVRANGHCEVKPAMRCVWTQAVERAQGMSHYGHELLHVLPPVNRSLQGSAAWINESTGVGLQNPHGWVDSLESR